MQQVRISRLSAAHMLAAWLAIGLLSASDAARGAGYYHGSAPVRECLSATWRANKDCEPSFDLALTMLLLIYGVDCLAAHGIKRPDDIHKLLKKYLRSHKGSDVGNDVVFQAFSAVSDIKLCPDTNDEAERASREELRRLREAAAVGNVDAQVEVGLRTFGEERRYWLCVAATQGSASGQYEYGRLLEVYDSNYPEAYVWYRRAEEKGYYLARDARAQVAERLDPSHLPDLDRQQDLPARAGCQAPPSE